MKNLFIRSKSSLATMLFVALMLCCPLSSFAQSNVNHLQLSVGALYERGFDVTLGYEHETKYHNSWEYFVNAYLKYEDDPEAGHITKSSFWNSYNTWMFGIAYKPCVVRHRNGHGNFRIGGMLGSNTKKVIGGGTIAYEHSYALRKGWEFFFQIRTDMVLGGRDFFRTGAALGFKAPL